MAINFLFLDESFNKDTKICSLTGILVPLDRFRDARTGFYQIIRLVLMPKDLPINPIFLDLHGRTLLQDFANAKDDLKLHVAQHIVDLVIQNKLEMVRVGHYITKENTELFGFDKNYREFCFQSLISRLQNWLKEESVIIIMDGFDRSTVHPLSKHIRSLDLMRELGFEQIMPVQNSVNILGEVFYADSQFSIFTQVTDIVSYLRQCSDYAREGKHLTDFKKKLIEVSSRLSPSIILEEITSFPRAYKDPS